MPLSSLQIKNWKLFWYEQPLIRSGRHVWGYIYMHISQVSCIYSRNMIKTMAWEHKRMTPTHTIYWIYRHLYLLSFNRKWNECRLHICYPLELSWTKKMLDLSLFHPPTLYFWLFKHVKGNIWGENPWYWILWCHFRTHSALHVLWSTWYY